MGQLGPAGADDVDGGVQNIFQRRMIGMLDNADQYAHFNAAPHQQDPPAPERPVNAELLRLNQVIQQKSLAKAPNSEVLRCMALRCNFC